MIKYILLLTVVFSLHLKIFAQDLISPQSATNLTSSSQISWTIGDMIIEPANGNTVSLTQGALRVETDAITSLIDNPFPELKIYPNPVSNILYLTFGEQNLSGISYTLFSIDGKYIKSNLIENETSIIDFTSIKSGIYLLGVINSKNKQSASYKIIKAN
ncbi:MAG: T9SS type A sorting domain-containing protein [Chitinophagales bacterium]